MSNDSHAHTTVEDGVKLALELIESGIPVVVCKPNPKWKPGSDESDVIQPTGWATATATIETLRGFVPGVDTLALVGGHGVDVLDVDAKAGATLSDLPDIEHYGYHVTPSGGWHILIPSTGLGKGILKDASGRILGDYVGGTNQGGSRMLCYLPGSARPKYPLNGYAIGDKWDITAAVDSTPDDTLVDWLIHTCGLSADGAPGAAPATSAEVSDFIATHKNTVDCPYAAAAWAGIHAKKPKPGDNRHPYFMAATARVVELARAGCMSTKRLDDLKSEFDKVKPGAHKEWASIVAWSVANTKADSTCDHRITPPRPFDPPQQAGETPFWDRRPFLRWVHDMAKARIVSPWALLGVTLARAAAEIDPHVELPALVVGTASLNLYVCLLGYSGVGKSGTTWTCSEAREWTAEQFDLGSTEGLIDYYIETLPPKDAKAEPAEVFTSPYEQVPGHPALRMKRTAGIAITDELASFIGQKDRSGNPILGTMLTAYNGGAINPAYRANKNLLPARSYRLCWVIGAQVGPAHVILDDRDHGLPQRFLWFAANDPKPDPDAPEPTDPMPWKVPTEATLPAADTRYIDVPDNIRTEIRNARAAAVAAAEDTLGAHTNLSKLKAAAVLALIEGRYNIDDEDWHIASLIIAHSDQRIETIKDERARILQQADISAGKSAARRAHIQQVATATLVTAQAAGQVARAVRKSPGGLTRKEARASVSSKLRTAPGFDIKETLAHCVAQQWVTASTRPDKRSGVDRAVPIWVPGPVDPTSRGGAK